MILLDQWMYICSYNWTCIFLCDITISLGILLLLLLRIFNSVNFHICSIPPPSATMLHYYALQSSALYHYTLIESPTYLSINTKAETWHPIFSQLGSPSSLPLLSPQVIPFLHTSILQYSKDEIIVVNTLLNVLSKNFVAPFSFFFLVGGLV